MYRVCLPIGVMHFTSSGTIGVLSVAQQDSGSLLSCRVLPLSYLSPPWLARTPEQCKQLGGEFLCYPQEQNLTADQIEATRGSRAAW